MTYQELKEVLDTLDVNQLKQEVLFLGDGKHYSWEAEQISSMHILPHYPCKVVLSAHHED